MGKVKRNMPCPCGSGLKYKKCCGKAEGAFPAVAVQELKQSRKTSWNSLLRNIKTQSINF